MQDCDAKMKDYLAITKLLLDAKADPNVKNNEGKTAFHNACADGNLDMIKLLFESGCDPNTVDNEGITPIRAAAENGHVTLVSYLEEVGCKLDVLKAEGAALEGVLQSAESTASA